MFNIKKDSEIIFAGGPERTREEVETMLEDKLGFFVMLQEWKEEDEDEDELELYVHTDSYNDLSEKEMEVLDHLGIEENDCIDKICSYLGIQVIESPFPLHEDPLYVNYIKFSNVDSEGNESEVNYALHLFNESSESIVCHSHSFEELVQQASLKKLFDIVSTFDESENNFVDTFNQGGGLYFNKTFFTYEQVLGFSVREVI